VLKLNFLCDSDYWHAPNGPFKEEAIEDSSQPVLTMPKCQEGLKDNPRSEMQQFRRDYGFGHKSSVAGQSWQNGKAENQHSNTWLSQCSAKAGAHTA
jgi:hypothetical protein